ncbi:hypothetical protein HDU81_006721 [Chytriomyces hyalinus]|nr:hypothetical protein HDU81_006721 [Chytriomyces hyalinus]
MDEESGVLSVPVPQRTTSIRTATPAKPTLRLQVDHSNSDGRKSGDGGAKGSGAQIDGGFGYSTDGFAASPPDSPGLREGHRVDAREASPRVLSPPPDEDWFLDYYASTPSTAPPVLRVPLPASHSSSTSAPSSSSSLSSSVPHPSLSTPLMHSNAVSSFPQGGLRRTNTASVLLGSKSKLSEKDVHIPARQSSRNTAFPFGARGLTSSPVQVPAVLADTKPTSRNHETQSPPPPSFKTDTNAPINSNHRVQIESLLESGARALALLNINDALSLWKQAASGAPEGSLLSVRALSNLCVAYRRQGDVAKSYESALDAWKILERHVWIEANNPVASNSAPASIASGSGRSLLSHGTVHSNASKEAGTLGANTDTVVNLLVGVGLIGFDEGFALGTDDSLVGLTGRKGTIGKGLSRKGSVAPSILGHGSHHQQKQQQQQEQQQQALQQKQLQQEQERQREEEDSKIDDALIKCMRAVVKVTKTWLERRRRTETPEPAKQAASSFLHKQSSFAHSHSSKIIRMASLDSFSSSSSAESSTSSMVGMPTLPQIPIDPVLLVSILNLATNTGNLYFTTNHYQLATILHEAALDLSQDILTTFPLPAKTAPPSTSSTSSIKLSYIHAHTLMTKNRSMSHLSLCLGAIGDVHRAVRFGQMAHSGSTSVAGPQPADRAGSHARQWRFTHAGVAGNLARAQFAVGRYVEGMRGCVAAVDLYARAETFTVDEKDEHKDKEKAASQADRAGLLRALANVGACWVEAGRLGCTVHVWVGDPAGAGLRRGAGPNGDSMPDFSFYDSHFAIPRPNLSVPSVSIPQRMHSSLRRDFVGTDVNLGVLDQVPVAFARKNAPLWFADVLTGIRLLQKVISEAGKYKYLECIGLARFNIASACIIIQKPYLAAQMLTEAPYAWTDIMKQVSRATNSSNNTNTPNTPVKNIPALDPSHLFSNQIVGSKALFNFTQLLFIIGSNRLIHASTLKKPSEAEAAATDKVSKLVLATVAEAGSTESHNLGGGSRSDTNNRSRTVSTLGDENESAVNLIDGIVDPDLHVVSLKLCLRLFDGSSQGPHSTPLSKIKSVEGLPSSPQKSFFSNDYHDVHSTDSSNSSNTRQQPSLVLPETPKPAGSPTSYTTRICLALARTLLTVYAPSLDRSGESSVSQRRVLMLRQEARRWCSAEATAGVENAAIASGASSSSVNNIQDKSLKDKETIGTGLAAKRGTELKRRSMVVKGSALEGLLVSALSGTGEVHGNLAMEVGSIVLEVEMLESKNWVLDDLLEDKLANSSPVTAYQDGIVHRLVRLASRRVRDGVIGPMRFEEAALEEAIRPFIVS